MEYIATGDSNQYQDKDKKERNKEPIKTLIWMLVEASLADNDLELTVAEGSNVGLTEGQMVD